MNIRDLQKTDVERVRAIARAAWRDTYSDFIPMDIQDKVLKEAYSDAKMENRFLDSLNLVAEVEGKIVGYAFFSGELASEDIYLESLYIHPIEQRKGIGRQLIEYGLCKYRELNSLTLTVYKHNSSISFYEKEGFVVISETEGDFFGHPVGFIKMRKEMVKKKDKGMEEFNQ